MGFEEKKREGVRNKDPASRIRINGGPGGRVEVGVAD